MLCCHIGALRRCLVACGHAVWDRLLSLADIPPSHTRIYKHTHSIFTHFHTRIYISTHAHVLTHIRTYAHAHIRTYAHTQTHIHTYTHVHMHTCTHIHINTYTHHHIITSSQKLSHSLSDNHICINTLIRIYTLKYPHTSIPSVHIHTHMHACSHTCTHAHTHVQIQSQTHVHRHARLLAHTLSHARTPGLSRLRFMPYGGHFWPLEQPAAMAATIMDLVRLAVECGTPPTARM